MKLIQTVLRRPVSVCMIVLAVLVFGISSIAGMPLGYMPDMEMPMELVMITWPGTDADSIERLVTEPVEDTCEVLSDVNTINSVTYDNYTLVQIQYNYGVDLDDAYMDLKNSLDNMDLPDGCNDPTIMEIGMLTQGTMMISANALNDENIQEYLENTVVPEIKNIGGVAKTDLSGTRDEYLRIVLDEAKLNQYGLSIAAIGGAIAAADFDMPVGSVTIGTQDVALSASGNVDISTQNIRNIPIQTARGQMIHLSDVTSFINLYQKDADSISRHNGHDSVLLTVTKANSADAVSVCREVEKILNDYSDGIVDFEIIYSEAENILDSISEVIKTLAIGVILTMLVLLLFFGEWRSCLIVGCSMPLSVFLAVILLGQMGFSFDLVTGTSLVIAIGMIVDNAIVVIESCFRANERGLGFHDAALEGTREVLMSVIAGTLTTVVVYVPLAMADGMSGQMSTPLSWTIALTMLSSLLCAVTIVPLIFSLVKPRAKQELPINRLLGKMKTSYRKTLPRLLRRPGRVIVAAVAILFLSFFLLSQMSFVLFPSDYDGSINLNASFRAGTKLEVIDEKVRELEKTLMEDTYFESVTLDISGNTASFTAYSIDNCPRGSEEAVEEYTRKYANAVDMDIEVTPTGSGGMGSMMTSGNTVDITLAADALSSLREGAATVEEMMASIPGVISIDNEFNQSRVQGKLIIDEQKALSKGMSQASVAMQVSYMLNGMTACTIDYDDKEYDVILEYPEGMYDDISALLGHPIATAAGTWISLGDIASVEYTTTLPAISRQDGSFVTTITATTSEKDKATVAKEANQGFKALTLPEGVSKGVSAMDKVTSEETSQMTSTLLTAIFLVFLVMAIQFDSPKLSLMVMMCIPFSLIGSFALAFIAEGQLSMIDLMGFLVLFGIVVNNGILLVDATNELRKTLPLGEALISAGETRLRPILMTTLTTVISMFPMLFSTDSGMNMMKGMSIIIIGGLVASTILTMFMMPPFYLLIRGEDIDGNKRRKKRKKECTD
ncbi:MAG: efflux RND transporter permease subunit [Oscillospiraceae bacterium]|nr:efflux RND transporter permease subunit [Oscillospiraceae bacterium]